MNPQDKIPRSPPSPFPLSRKVVRVGLSWFAKLLLVFQALIRVPCASSQLEMEVAFPQQIPWEQEELEGKLPMERGWKFQRDS